MKVAVLGCGSVGSQVVRLLVEQADDLGARIGARVVVRRETEDDLLATDMGDQ